MQYDIQRDEWLTRDAPAPTVAFRHYQDWIVHKEYRTFPAGVVFIDTLGRACASLDDFRRAHDENAFPVSYVAPVKA